MNNNNFPHPSNNYNPYPYAAASGGENQEPDASSSFGLTTASTPIDSQHPDLQQKVAAELHRRMQQARAEQEEKDAALMQLLSQQQQMNAAAGGVGASAPNGMDSPSFGPPSQMNNGHMINGHVMSNHPESVNSLGSAAAGINGLSTMTGAVPGSQQPAMNNFMPMSQPATFMDSINMNPMNAMNPMTNLSAATTSVVGDTSSSSGFGSKVLPYNNLPQFDSSSQMSNFMLPQSAFTANNGQLSNMNPTNNMNGMEYLQKGQLLGLHQSSQGGCAGQNGVTSSSIMGSNNLNPFQKDNATAGTSIMDPSNTGMAMLGACSSTAAAAAVSLQSHAPSQEDPGWDEQFRALRTYHLKFGHTKVPARYTGDPRLGRWVMTQRRQFTLLMKGFPSALTTERIRRLEGLGFVWSVRPEPVTTWNRKYQELKAYKATYGNCMVPQRYQANPQLGTWVHTQRRQYKLMASGKNSSMTREKADALDSIGFFWAAKHVTSPTTTGSAATSYLANVYARTTSDNEGGSDGSDAGGRAKAA